MREEVVGALELPQYSHDALHYAGAQPHKDPPLPKDAPALYHTQHAALRVHQRAAAHALLWHNVEKGYFLAGRGETSDY